MRKLTATSRIAGIVSMVLVLVLSSTLLLAPIAQAAEAKYEYYDSNEDAGAEIYGVNWSAQTFTTSNSSPHSITKVVLKLYRTGLPGTVTASIRRTTSGEPVGADIASGTCNGSSLSDSSPGTWVDFDFTVEANLEMDTMYAIVVRAVAGNSTQKVHWRMDGSSSTYTGGQELTSTDSGSSWTADSDDDYMFEIWGNATVELLDVKVFSSVMEDGDWLFLIHYNNQAPPGYPGEDPQQYFNVKVVDDTTDVAQVKMPAWGYKPMSIYLSDEASDELTWASEDISIEIESNSDMLETDVSTSYSLVYTDWLGADLVWLDEWVRDIAQDIEDYYGVDVYTETVGDVTLPSGEGVLTLIGSEIFLIGIHGLDELRPHLFHTVTHELDPPSEDFDPAYEGSTTWQEQVGPQASTLLSNGGDLVNLPGNTFGGVLMFAGYIGLVAIGMKATKTPAVATALAIPMAIGAMYLRLIPFAVMAIVSMLMLFMTVWILYLRGT